MTLLSISYVFLVAGLLGFCFSRLWSDNDNKIQVSAWMLGACLTPAFISLIELGLFKLLSGWTNSTITYLMLPLIVAFVLARTTRGLTLDRDVLPQRIVDVRKVVLVFLFVLLTFGSLVGLLINNVASLQIDHDLSVYLAEATELFAQMTSDLEDGASKQVTQPHSLAYSTYLAWGFIFEPAAGFGSDMTPKALIGLNHVALLLAVAGLIYSVSNWYWAVISAAMILFNPVFDYQVNYFARDTFYITPIITLFFLLLHSWRSDPRLKFHYLIFIALATVGSITGHTLGLVGVIAILVGFVFAYAGNGLRKILLNNSLQVSGVLVFLFSCMKLFELIADETSSKKAGFAFPYYSDPFVKQAFEQDKNWGSDPGVLHLIGELLTYNGISVSVCIFGLIIIFAVLTRAAVRKTISENERLCLSASVSVLAILLMVIFFPLDLDGLTLASAFSSNLRYGFLCGILFYLSIILASQILLNSIPYKLVTPISFIFLLLVSSSALMKTRKIWPSTDYETRAAISRIDNCKLFTDRGYKKVYSDGDDFIYICPNVTKYLFTEEGSKLLSQRQPEKLFDEIDRQGIDAFIFNRSVDYWWSGSTIFQFLKKHWTSHSTSYGVVFLRPEE